MRVSLIQLTVENDVNENFLKVKDFLNLSLAKKPNFILLPECFLFLSNDLNENKKNALAPNNSFVNFFKSFAKKNKLFLLLGSISIKERNSLYNMSLLINSNGDIVSSYKKIHMFDVKLGNGEEYRESETFDRGNELVLFKSNDFTLGHSICYDLRFPKLYRALAKNGSNLIVAPSAFTYSTGKYHWHTLVRSRAIENGVFLFAPNQWGTNRSNRSTYGHSLIVNPWGEVLADGEEGEKIINCTIDLNEVKNARSAIPSLDHDLNFENHSIEKFKIITN